MEGELARVRSPSQWHQLPFGAALAAHLASSSGGCFPLALQPRSLEGASAQPPIATGSGPSTRNTQDCRNCF